MIGPKVQPPTEADQRDAYELVTLRDANVCQKCLSDCGPIARDHRKNRSQGAFTLASELQLLGLGCHTWKTEHPADAVDEGWAVPGYPRADPAQWPARRWLHPVTGRAPILGWVLYDDDGGITPVSVAEARSRMFSMGWGNQNPGAFQARHAGVCGRCQKRVSLGDMVIYQDGNVHTDCEAA